MKRFANNKMQKKKKRVKRGYNTLHRPGGEQYEAKRGRRGRGHGKMVWSEAVRKGWGRRVNPTRNRTSIGLIK